MLTSIAKFSAAALAMAALPGIAHAGTSSATGTTTFGVINQCSVAGASVNLGAFRTTDTWGTVGASLGVFANNTFTAGSRGLEYLNYGSVTCDNAQPYTLSIAGTNPTPNPGGIKLTVNGKVVVVVPAAKKIGANTLADSNANLPGMGQLLGAKNVVSTRGTGAAQAVLGSVVISEIFAGTTALLTDALTTSGAYTDTLTYTLRF
ncbi:MAG: hypothetical protein RLZZ84_436 [Pseudomonadota bacterium]|jgi:hypothetical protein